MNKRLLYLSCVSSINIFYAGAQEAPKSNTPVAKPAAAAKEKSPVVAESKAKEAVAFDGKIATAGNILIVDFFEAAEKSAFGQDTQKSMREKADVMGKELQQDERNLTQAATEFKTKASTMNDAAREKEELRLKKMQREYAEKRQDYEEEIKGFSEKLMKDLGEEFTKAVTSYAQANDIDAVIDRATGRFIYVADQVNRTSDIVALMDKEHTTKIAQAKQNAPVAKSATAVAANAPAPKPATKAIA